MAFRASALVAFLLLLLLLLGALAPTTAGAAVATPPAGAPGADTAVSGHGAHELGAPAQIFWSHPLRPTGAAPAHALPTGNALPSLSTPASGFNGSLCAISNLPAGQEVPMAALNFSIAVTPANLTSYGPMNFTWNTTVYGVGLPPFHTQLSLDSWIGNWTPSNYANGTHITTVQDSGSVVLNTTGMYAVLFEVFDSSCLSVGVVQFNLELLNSTLGATPITVATASSSGTAPTNVTYRVTGVPANYTLTTYNGLYVAFPGSATVSTVTYYLPGAYNVTICLVEPSGYIYSCVVTPNVIVGGPGPIALAVRVGTGSSSVPVQIWGNVTNTTLIPANSSLYLYAYDGNVGLTVEAMSGTGVALNESVGCGAAGYPTEENPGAMGTCEFSASFSVWNPGLAIYYGYIEQSFNVTAAGNLSQWVLTGTFTHGPSNFSSAPGSFSVNATVSGGDGNGTYWAWYTLFGDSSFLANASLLPNQCPNDLAWNGSLATTTFPLSHVGVYWGAVLVTDLHLHYAWFLFPIISVGLRLPSHYALSIWANETSSHPLSTNATPLAVTFSVTTSGGAGPYSVEWAFGDGTFGTSSSDAVVTHVYRTAGTYTPVVGVTDSQGVSVNETLPAVVVTNPTSTSPAGNSTPPPAHPTGVPVGRNNTPVPSHPRSPPTVTTASAPRAGLPWNQLVPAVAAGAGLIAIALLWRRRQLRVEGEALVLPSVPHRSVSPEPGP